MRASLTLFLARFAAGARTTYLLSGTGSGWKFELLGGARALQSLKYRSRW
jgi:hypothetical protein